MLASFPELESDYKQTIVEGELEDDGPAVTYSLVFVPFLEKVLLDEPEGAMAERIFGFLRALEDDADEETAELAWTEIARHLRLQPDMLAFVRPRLGPKMRDATLI